MGEIFVSYSNHDQDFATALNQWLARSWIGDLDRQGGYSSRRRLAGGHQSCTCGVSAFLIVLSPNCIASKNVVKELSIAESRSRHIVPVMYQACEIPPEMEYQLAGLQWINFPEMGFDQAIKRLVATLEKGKQARPDKPKMKPAGGQPAPPMPGGSFPPPPAPQPVSQPQELARILCGRWNVQIGAAYVGPVGQLALDLYPNGAFNGQLMTPAGPSAVGGQWMITPVGQLMLQGQQIMGWTAGPYAVLVQLSQVTPFCTDWN